jgi:23S rRNA pseudouridine1911/1915/1917 synthase
MPTQTIIVLPQDEGRRLDVVISAFTHEQKLGLSRNAVQALVESGAVLVDGQPVRKSNQKLKSGQHIGFSYEEAEPVTVAGEDLPLDIVYEDDDLVVVNKPSGLVVHPAPGNQNHTLVNALLHHCKKLSTVNPLRPGIVHRLDKETSGLLVAAKNNPSHLSLAEQFAEHSIRRVYVAIVRGRVNFDENVIDMSIGRHPQSRKKMAAGFGSNPKSARTHYRTLKRTAEYSVVELHPFTGRTHQLRVHLAFLGHPILGDAKYGRQSDFPRLALHAKVLGFVHPATGSFIEFDSPLPQEFKPYL